MYIYTLLFYNIGSTSYLIYCCSAHQPSFLASFLMKQLSPSTAMGFRQAAVLGPVCFFLGVLFICFNIDYRVLWGGLTADTVEDGFQFYTTFFNAPPAIKVRRAGWLGSLLTWHRQCCMA